MSREEQELRDVERQMEEQLIQQYSQVRSRRKGGGSTARRERDEGCVGQVPMTCMWGQGMGLLGDVCV